MTLKHTLLALGLGGALAFSAVAAGAHEMFLKPASFHVAPNAKTTVALFNGTIHKSENPITRDRMKSVAVASGGKVDAPPASQWRDDAVTS